MSYVVWTLIALVAYAFMTTILKMSLRTIPPEAAVIFTNVMLVVMAVLWAIYRGVKVTEQMGLNQPTLLLVVAGLLLGVGVISLYMALSRGPASIVAPLFGMNLALVAVLGFVVLREPLNVERVAGIFLAAGAVFLLTR